MADGIGEQSGRNLEKIQMRKLSWIFLLLLMVSLWAVGGEKTENHVPLVTKVRAEQVDFAHVLIRYDVEDADRDMMTVSVKVSANNKQSFDVPVTELEGAVGKGITSGTGKEIVWTITQDVALHQYGEGYVVADDKVGPEQRITWEKDGSEMVLIPAGSFEMGDHFNEGRASERPGHEVKLDAFYMGVNEVTVGQFKKFVQQTGYAYGGDWNDVARYSPGDDYPMIYVSWHDAVAYAEWVGKRLSTEAEWEYAARGGLVGKRYPWGDEISHDDANWGNTVNGRDKWKYCSPVGSFVANGYGLYDMVGNVSEWCQDWYGSDYYSNQSQLRIR